MFHKVEGRKTVECLDEFDDAKEVVSALSAEYEACESADYITRAAGHAPHAAATSAATDLRSPASVSA